MEKIFSINGDGWRFIVLNKRLYFYSNHKSWDHKLKDLIIDTAYDYVSYIKLKNSKGKNEDYFFRVYFEDMFDTVKGYGDAWRVDKNTYDKIRKFLMGISSLTYG